MIEERIKNSSFLNDLKIKFATHFQNRGYLEYPGVPITSGIDPTVRFIGSHTSVLKQYFDSKQLPREGIFLNQECLKNRNLRSFYDETIPQFGSYYPCQGLLAHYTSLVKVVRDTFDYFYDVVGIKKTNSEVWISSSDTDLISAIQQNDLSQIQKLDTLPPHKYQHKFGSDELSGRNLNIAVTHSTTKKQTYAAVIIVLEKAGAPTFIEVAISPALLITQVLGLSHILDCFPVPSIPTSNFGIQRKIEDCIIASIVLYREGLKPSNYHNRNRILKKYLIALKSLSNKINLCDIGLMQTLETYEKYAFNEITGIAQEIVRDANCLLEGKTN